jgi:hypothetical protein
MINMTVGKVGMPSRSKELESPLVVGALSGQKNLHKRRKTVVQVFEVASCRQK